MIVAQTHPTAATVARHYDDLDEFYREVWGEHVHHGLWRTGRETRHQAVVQLTETVAERACVRPGDAVCDVGCGYGATARWLASNRGARVTALTVTPRQFQYARAIEPEAANPTYLLRDWLENDLEPEQFDALIAIESIEHMTDQAAAFRQAARVLKPGGKLVVCAWLAGDDPAPWQRTRLLQPICEEGRLPGMGTRAEVGTWMEAAGFAVEHFEDISANVRRTWLICIGRAIEGLCQHPEWRRFLFDRAAENRVFALTVMRIWLAYLTGAMRYGIFTARRWPHSAAIPK